MYKISLNFTVTFIPKEMAILVIRPFILINLLLLLLLFFLLRNIYDGRETFCRRA